MSIGGVRNTMTMQDSLGSSVLKSRYSAITTRERLRLIDITESRMLLLELGLHEPNISQCFSLLSDACLSDNMHIEVDGRALSPKFHTFFNYHYQAFCREAVRAMFIYGFVPWHPRKLTSGDIVPSVLPHGTFTWRLATRDNMRDRAKLEAGAQQTRSRVKDVQLNQPPEQVSSEGKQAVSQKQASAGAASRQQIKDASAGDKRKRASELVERIHAAERQGGSAGRAYASERWGHLEIPRHDYGSRDVQYVVELTHSSVHPSDVFIFEYEQAHLNIMENSVLHATVPSPLSHLLGDYRALRDAQMRRRHADAWNTTARIFTSCVPPNASNEEPTQSFLYYETGSDRMRIQTGRSHMDARHKELHNQITQPSNHVPVLYNLPVHHKLEQLPNLVPCEDLEFLLEKFRRDVCGLIGVPYEMVFGRGAGGGGTETSARSNVNGRLFSKTVQRMCDVVQQLVKEVYCEIYGTQQNRVTVTLNPMPRLDISSIEDVRQLWEMGAVTPDVMAQLSEILLISESTNVTGKARETTHSGKEYSDNLRNVHMAMRPPPAAASGGGGGGAQSKKK